MEVGAEAGDREKGVDLGGPSAQKDPIPVTYFSFPIFGCTHLVQIKSVILWQQNCPKVKKQKIPYPMEVSATAHLYRM